MRSLHFFWDLRHVQGIGALANAIYHFREAGLYTSKHGFNAILLRPLHRIRHRKLVCGGRRPQIHFGWWSRPLPWRQMFELLRMGFRLSTAERDRPWLRIHRDSAAPGGKIRSDGFTWLGRAEEVPLEVHVRQFQERIDVCEGLNAFGDDALVHGLAHR
jgi:hypothetical protein